MVFQSFIWDFILGVVKAMHTVALYNEESNNKDTTNSRASKVNILPLRNYDVISDAQNVFSFQQQFILLYLPFNVVLLSVLVVSESKKFVNRLVAWSKSDGNICLEVQKSWLHWAERRKSFDLQLKEYAKVKFQ